MSERKSNLEIAKAFHAYHELLFRQAVAAKTTVERQFVFSDAQFDDWAVAEGLLPKAARTASNVEHGSIIFARNTLRRRLNLAARRGDGMPLAYSIEARAQRWRVVLLEKFVDEQPTDIVRGIQRCLERSDRTAALVKRYLAAQEQLTEEDRLRIAMRLDMAQMWIWNGLQMMEVIIMGFQSDKPPNMKRLRRKMAQVLINEVNQSNKVVKLKPKKPAA